MKKISLALELTHCTNALADMGFFWQLSGIKLVWGYIECANHIHTMLVCWKGIVDNVVPLQSHVS